MDHTVHAAEQQMLGRVEHDTGRRWCSRKICGNRIKARRHYRRGHLAD
jgi:predicted RNA-binding Zn ribbon-like protein